jgi:hypothetical protein
MTCMNISKSYFFVDYALNNRLKKGRDATRNNTNLTPIDTNPPPFRITQRYK